MTLTPPPDPDDPTGVKSDDLVDPFLEALTAALDPDLEDPT